MAEPIRLLLSCPRCGVAHVDAGEWASRPHKTHRCLAEDGGCGHEWRPFEFATVGIRRDECRCVNTVGCPDCTKCGGLKGVPPSVVVAKYFPNGWDGAGYYYFEEADPGAGQVGAFRTAEDAIRYATTVCGGSYVAARVEVSNA